MKFLVFVILSATVAFLEQSANEEKCQRRVCEYNSFQVNNLGSDFKFPPADIDVSLCTHIAYYGVQYDSTKDSPVIANREVEGIVGLKENHPNLKVLLFINAYNCNHQQNIEIASTESTRQRFADNIVQYIKDHNFDGFVYGCTFIGSSAGDQPAPKVLTNITIALNQAFTRESTDSNKLELVLYAYGTSIFYSYEISELSANVDWIILDAVLLQGYWYDVTGHHSPLYPNYNNLGVHPEHSVDTAVKLWIDNGAPRDKLVITLPAFGVHFTLTGSESGIGAPATQGWRGHYSWKAFYDVCKHLQNAETRRYFIHKQRVPYLVDGDQWIGYDDVGSLKQKVRYIKEQQLGGFFFKSLHHDDTQGNSCGQGRYPLLKAINDECLK